MNQHGGYRGPKQNILDFSININPLGMPPRLKYDLEAAFDDLGKYPEPDAASHKKRLAGRFGVSDKQVIVGNGGIDLIYLFTRALYAPNRAAMIVVPTFNEYARALKMNGWDRILLWETGAADDFKIDADAFAQAVAQRNPAVIFLCNPCNPTGLAYSPAFIADLIERCGPDIQWFIDESFIDFSAKQSAFDLFRQGKRLVLLRSMTKFFGIPGLRLGYAVGPEEVITAMARYQMPWSVNSLALTALDTVFDDTKYIDDTKSYVQKERHRVFNALSGIHGLTVYPSSADFHLCHLDNTETTAAALNTRLNEHDVNIRICEDFTGLDDHYFRAAVKKKDANDKLIAALQEEVTWD